MYVKFWGVRGSYPAPGPATSRVGGNTSCVQVRTPGGGELIVDAGTGIRRLGQQLTADGFNGRCHLLISHTHWDHIQGLPFFGPLYGAENGVHIYARQRDVHLNTLFANQTADPYFPISLDEVAARVRYHEVVEGTEFAVEDARVRCVRLNHPYIAVGYRIDCDGGSVAYMSDTAPFDRMVLGYDFIASRPDPTQELSDDDADLLARMKSDVVDICRDADLVIYDTMFEHAEYLKYPHWGHSTPEQALDLLQQANARCLALFHHHPDRSDEQQLAIWKRVEQASEMPVVLAREGMEMECRGGGGQVVS
jgi:phosphoribosyl 1,2-cyclic phosphodiesterase